MQTQRTLSLGLFAALACYTSIAFGAESDKKEDAAAIESIRNGKHLFVGLKLFAGDHDGAFPVKLEELLPDYVRPEHLACPLSPKERIGYDYFLLPPDGPKRIMLQSKSPTKAGKWVVIYSNGDSELKAEREKPAE
jgi:hypothetical protein